MKSRQHSRCQGRAHSRRGADGQLTSAEQQVAELAAAGLRNSEIAAKLFLSGKTVEANLSRAYRKIGVRSRTELAGHGAAQAERAAVHAAGQPEARPEP
jgi:DNA-binding NarL/FixJ family response regulator